MKKNFFRIISFILILTMLMPVAAMAIETRTNPYIAYYVATIKAIGDGKIRVGFDVTGTGDMEKIGTTQIKIYDENGYLKKTYRPSSYDGLLAENTFCHSGNVVFQGTVGVSYFAKVTCFAQGADGSSTETYTTTLVEAE
ncbi:MAG: hypothetical protein ACOX81_00950 [Candidatus Heteroscillospira sp.]|jgi:hypothetical protein